MPISGMPPVHSRSSSMVELRPVAPNTRNRAASADSPLNLIAANESATIAHDAAPAEPAEPAVQLTQEDLKLLQESFKKWESMDGHPVVSRERDSTEFLRSINDGDAQVEGGQIVMRISEGEDPILPLDLAAKKDPATGAVVEKAKVKFVHPEPPSGFEQPRPSMQYEPTDAGRQRNVPEQKFSMPGDDPAPREASPYLPPVMNAISIQVTPASSSPQSVGSASARSSASGSPGLRADEPPSPRASERFANFARNLVSSTPNSSAEDKQAYAALKSAPKLSKDIYGVPGETLAKFKAIEKSISDLSSTPRQDVATESSKILARVSRLRSGPIQLDCMTELAKHVLAASSSATAALPAEKDFFNAMGRQLEALTPTTREEIDLRVTLMKISRPRGQTANEYASFSRAPAPGSTPESAHRSCACSGRKTRF